MIPQQSFRIIFLPFIILFISFNSSYAQGKKNTTESIRPVLEQVIGGAPTDFVPIRGEQIPADPGTTQFLSTAVIPSALESKIIGYSGITANYWVWESKLLVTDDFNELKKVYKQYFNDINGGMIKTVDRKYISSEKFESPTEELRQCINQFTVSGSDVSNETLTIDLVAENVMFEWIVWLRVYDKNKMSADQ
jgi:hypothetical protein